MTLCFILALVMLKVHLPCTSMLIYAPVPVSAKSYIFLHITVFFLHYTDVLFAADIY